MEILLIVFLIILIKLYSELNKHKNSLREIEEYLRVHNIRINNIDDKIRKIWKSRDTKVSEKVSKSFLGIVDKKLTSDIVVETSEVVETKVPAEQFIEDVIPPQTTLKSIPIDESEKEIIEKEPADAPNEPIRKIWWKKLLEQTMENWTGIFGSIIMVMGVVFFGVYSALKVGPFYRCLMIVIVAGILAVSSIFLEKKEKWLKMGLWLRSCAGAIFLFVCLGSSSYEMLRWIEKPMNGLVALAIGLGLNLYLGIAERQQFFGTLHIFLCMVALAIAPQSQLIFLIACIVTLFGIYLSFRQRWDYHLLATIVSFFIYHFNWYQKVGNIQTSRFYTVSTVVSLILVFSAALAVHYKSLYRCKHFEKLPFFVHFLTWIFAGTSIYMHSTGLLIKPFLLICASVAAFFIAKRGRKKEILWLHHTDTLISQAIFILALVSFYQWKLDAFFIIIAVFIESMLFCMIMLKEEEEFLLKIGCWSADVFGVILIFAGMSQIDHASNKIMLSHSVLLYISAIAAAIFRLYVFRKSDGVIQDSISFNFDRESILNCSVLGILTGIILMVAYFNFYPDPWVSLIISIAALPFLFLRHRFQQDGLGIGLLPFLISIVTTSIVFQINLETPMPIIQRVLYNSPLLILPLVFTFTSYFKSMNKYIRWVGIYLFAVQLCFGIYFIFNPISTIITGVLCLLFSMIFLELACYYRNKHGDMILESGSSDRYLLHVGYALILVFLYRHITVHLQSEKMIWLISFRQLIEIFAIGVFFFWCSRSRPESDITYKSWRFLHPLFTELILLFTTFIIIVAASQRWMALIMIAMAFGCYIIGTKLASSRLRLYSLFYFLASIVQLAFIVSLYVTPSVKWIDQAWLSGSFAIILQFIYSILVYKIPFPEEIEFPESLLFLKPVYLHMTKWLTCWIYYPMFLGIAVFFSWAFSNALLTLLLVIECFMLFVLYIIFKEKHFHYVSMLSLALCLIRLMVYDLEKSNSLTRAGVFFGVGILMLIMSSLYNKFKKRF